jgi:UDP-N-acetylglucosamine 3-dehydrogenase
MNLPLRAGLIGLGMMGRNHARVLRSLTDVELVAVCDPAGDPSGAARGIPCDADLATTIERGLDLAVIAAPTEDHVRLGMALAAAGVATLIEKPLALDHDAARALADEFQRRGVLGAVGHVERCNAAVRALRTRLQQGELGDLYQLATYRQGPFPHRIRDVGVVKDLATHDLDLAEWVTGLRYTDVAARTAHRAGRPYEDLVAVVGSLGDGTVTSHLVNWLTPTKERRIVVTGDRGCFVADTLTADLTFYANGVVPSEWEAISKFRGVAEGDMIRYAIAKPEPLRVELEQFRDAILGHHSDVMTMSEGVRVLEVADAVASSARDRGRTVRLDEERA